ncbi:MAG: hypothetical protein AAGJ46_03815 [Planctomycetota bacterium]
MTAQEASQPPRPWGVACLLILVAVGQMSGRLMAVDAVDLGRLELHRIDKRLAELREELTAGGSSEEAIAERIESRRAELEEKLKLGRPFLSSNDRSRWMAIRALVEHGTYAIDDVYGEPTWDSIDIVQHRDAGGDLRLYSSKPPLLITIIAGEYWLLHQLTGWTLGTHPYTLGRVILMTTNVLPMAVMLLLVAAVADRLLRRLPGPTDTNWAWLFIVASGAFGTMLLPFAVALNNHVVAAVSASVVLYAWAQIALDGEAKPRWYALAGFAAAFTAANELPALALLVFLGGLLFARNPRLTLAWFTPAAAVVVVAFFATNYAAHNTLSPPYAHRSEGDNWYEFTFEVNGRERQSYWSQPSGIDRGEASKLTYALHVLAGHHGVFSMTPLWLLTAAGLTVSVARGGRDERELALLVLALSVICLTFYIGFRPQGDRNYGGMTNGFRWMFWFAPLWLATMAPAARWCQRSMAGRVLAGLLLAASAFSAAYPTWNPWTSPWVYRWMEAAGFELL